MTLSQCSAASSWRQARTKIFRTTDEADTAHAVSELLTARKLWLYLFSWLRSNRHITCVQCARDTAYFESYATDVFITPCLSPCSVEARRKGTHQCCYKFWLWIFFFCNLFFQNFFFQIFFPKIFFPKIFFQQFFSQNFFPTSFQNLFFEGCTLDALPFTETKRTLCTYLCYEKYDIQANIAFRLQHTKFSVHRLILRPGHHTTLSFKIQN